MASSINKAAIAAGDRIRQAIAKNTASNSTNFEKSLAQYNARASQNNTLKDFADTVSRTARDAAAIKAQQQRDADYELQNQRSAQQNENRRALEAQQRQIADNQNAAAWERSAQQRENSTNLITSMLREDSLRAANEAQALKARTRFTSGSTFSSAASGNNIKYDYAALNASRKAEEQSADASRLKLRDETNQDADRGVQRTTDANSRLQRERAEQGLTSQRDATEANSRLQRERAEQGLRSQQLSTDGNSRLQRERADQGLVSQREATEGNSRLQRERSEQTSKLQTQAAAEAAARTAGSRAAAIEAFRKFGRGKGA